TSWTPLRDRRRDGRDEKRRQCSIGRMKRLLALLAAGLGLRALLHRRSHRAPAPSPADDLREKLAQAKAQEQAPEPAGEPTPAPSVDDRRADIHAGARRAIDDLRETP